MTVVAQLKEAKIAYEFALEYDFCPFPDESGYEGSEEYSGCRPDEIVSKILELIDNL